jgi:hypothetical protein
VGEVDDQSGQWSAMQDLPATTWVEHEVVDDELAVRAEELLRDLLPAGESKVYGLST